MSDDLDILRELVALGETLPQGEWRWEKNYELGDGDLYWAISAPESSKDGRILDCHTVLFSGPYERPPGFETPQPSAIMQLWTAAANARPALSRLLARLASMPQEKA